MPEASLIVVSDDVHSLREQRMGARTVRGAAAQRAVLWRCHAEDESGLGVLASRPGGE